MDRGTWRATVHSVAKSQTRLSSGARARAHTHTHTHTHTHSISSTLVLGSKNPNDHTISRSLIPSNPLEPPDPEKQ